MNKNLVFWYYIQIRNIYIKLDNKKKLTKKQKYIYDMLDEYDFYAPKYIQNYKKHLTLK